MPVGRPSASVASGKPTLWFAHGTRVAVIGFSGGLAPCVATAVLAPQVHCAVEAAALLAVAPSPTASVAQAATSRPVVLMRCIPQPPYVAAAPSPTAAYV